MVIRARQPALLYLVPAALLAALGTAAARGELSELYAYKEEEARPHTRTHTHTHTLTHAHGLR